MTDFERRFTPGVVELRADGDRPRIGGLAIATGKYSRDLGGFIEMVDPAALNHSRGLGWPNVIARYEHRNDFLLGTTAAGTLRLHVGTDGLHYEVDPPQSRADVTEWVARGDIRFSSFAFSNRNVKDEWTRTKDGHPLRTLVSMELLDVAPVVSPAYPDATSGLRSLARHFDADYEEVRSMAERNELRKFFTRTPTDTPAENTHSDNGRSSVARARLLLEEKRLLIP